MQLPQKEILYPFKMIFEKKSIPIWAYNIETVLAEKAETILQRGELNTRPRDFYDIYILVKTQEFDKSIFDEALRETAKHRDTNHIFEDLVNRIKIIESSEILKVRWIKYTKNYPYAKEINYEDAIKALKTLID